MDERGWSEGLVWVGLYRLEARRVGGSGTRQKYGGEVQERVVGSWGWMAGDDILGEVIMNAS